MIIIKVLGGAAQIPRTHRRGEGVALDLSEALHLQRADEGDEGVHSGIAGLRHKGGRYEHGKLDQDDDLPPVQGGIFAKAALYHLRDDDTDEKGEDRHQVILCPNEISLEQIYPEEDDVAGLRVCEYPPPRHKRVGVEKAPGER